MFSSNPAVPFVGLTGGIGSGKTVVSEIFKKLGVPVVDTDVIAHELSSETEFIRKVETIFGSGVIDKNGQVDRAKLREDFFLFEDKKSALESFFHPLIVEKAKEYMNVSEGVYGILVVPLLFESKNYLSLIKRSLLVDSSEKLQISRVQKRSGLSEDEVKNIIHHQMARQEKLQLADDIIINDKGENWLTHEVMRLNEFYLNMFHQKQK